MKMVLCKVCNEYDYARGATSNTCLECESKGLKYCSSCNTVKQRIDFHANKAKGDGLCGRCKSCECDDSAQRKKVKYDTNTAYREEQKERKRNYRQNLLPHKREAYNAKRREAYDLIEQHKAAMRYNERRNVPGVYTVAQWERSLGYFRYQCAYCGETHKLTVDHVKAVSRGGTNYIYNLIPACKSCNSSKGAKDIVEWYTAQEFYSEYRLQRIFEWYKDTLQQILAQVKEGSENASC